MNARTALRAATSLLSIGCGVFLCSAAPAAAAVGNVGSGGYEAGLQYSTGVGVDSDLTVSFSDSRWTFVDTAVSKIDVEAAVCSQGSAPNIAICSLGPGGPPLDVLSIDVGDGDDSVRINDIVAAYSPTQVYGPMIYAGSGNDLVIAGQKGAYVVGGVGDNLIVGSPSADYLNGNFGNDTFRGGAGSDSINGGAGRDSVTYGTDGRTAGVRAVLDGATRSGREGVDGVGDLLAGIEDVTGTAYTDVLTGNASNNVLRGNGGIDQLTGLAGDDTLIATGGPSWLDGGDGNDLLQAKNTFKDLLGCGAGTDTAKIDGNELFVPFAECETLTA